MNDEPCDDGRNAGDRSKCMRVTIGNVLYDLIIGTSPGPPFWRRLLAMTFGGVVFHIALFILSVAALPFSLSSSPLILYTVVVLIGINLIFYVIVCSGDPPKGNSTRYFTLGVLLPGGAYVLAGVVARYLVVASSESAGVATSP